MGARQSIDYGTTSNPDCENVHICQVCGTAEEGPVCRVIFEEPTREAVICGNLSNDEAVTCSGATDDEDLANEVSSGLSKDDTFEQVADEMTEMSSRSESKIRGISDPAVWMEEGTLVSALEKIAEASARKHMEDTSKFSHLAATLHMVSEMEEEEDPVLLPLSAQVTKFLTKMQNRGANHQCKFDEESAMTAAEIWSEVSCNSGRDEVPADKISWDNQCAATRTPSGTASRTVSCTDFWTDLQTAPTVEVVPPEKMKTRRAAFACKVRILMATHLLGMCVVAVLVELVCGRVPNILMRILLWAASGAILLAVVALLHRLLRTCAASTFHLLTITVSGGAFVGLSPGGLFSCQVTGIISLASWLSATIHGTCSLRSGQEVAKVATIGFVLASWLLAFMLNIATISYVEAQVPEASMSVSIEAESAVAAISLVLTLLVHWDLETRMQCCGTDECLRPVVQVTIDTFSAAVVPLGFRLCGKRSSNMHQDSATCHDNVTPETKAALPQRPTADEIMAYFGVSQDAHESPNLANVSDDGEDCDCSNEDTFRL